MIDSQFFIEVLKGVIVALMSGIPSFIIGMWYFNKYLMPRMAPKMIIRAIETPEVQDLIKRGKGVMDKIEPLIEKLKDLNLEEIDGKVINDLLISAKKLADDFGKKLEKPDIPKPEDPKT